MQQAPSLFYFSVFHDKPQKEDDVSENVLLFYPPTFSQAEQKKHLGMCSGLAQFVKTFGPDNKCKSVRSQKHRLCMISMPGDEYEILFIININLGFRIKTISKERCLIEFMDSSINDVYVHNFLDDCRKLFELKFGSFTTAVEKHGVNDLRHLLYTFYIPLLEHRMERLFCSLETQRSIAKKNTTSNTNALGDLFQKVDFAPAAGEIDFNFLCCLLQLQRDIDNLSYFMVIHDETGQISANNVPANDIYSIYLYYVAYRNIFFNEKQKSQTSNTFVSSGYFTQIFLEKEYQVKEFYNSTYRILLMFSDKADDDRILESVPLVLSQYEFAQVSAETTASFSKGISHIYFNASNKAIKIFGDQEIVGDKLRYITHLQRVLDCARPLKGKEVYFRFNGESWIACSQVLERTLCSVISNQRKDMTLVDVDEEIKKVKNSHLKNVYFN